MKHWVVSWCRCTGEMEYTHRHTDRETSRQMDRQRWDKLHRETDSKNDRRDRQNVGQKKQTGTKWGGKTTVLTDVESFFDLLHYV